MAPGGRGGKLEAQRPRHRILEHGARIVFPAGRLYVDIQLDLIAVRVFDVQAVGHAVIGRTDDPHPRKGDRVPRLAELVVGLADLEAKVVKPNAGPARIRGGAGPALVSNSPGSLPPEREGAPGNAEPSSGLIP